MSIQNVSSSYLQDNRHSNVSESFNVVTPAAVGQVMADNGLVLASLKTGQARHVDKMAFQSTISRYRDNAEILPGINLDLLHISKHMGRGVDKIMLGIYRLICSNGLWVGSNFFYSPVRHSGDTYNNLSLSVAEALSKRLELTDLIQRMRSCILSDDAKQYLTGEALKLLTPANAVSVQSDLNRVRREADKGPDLWTTFNRIQESAMMGGTVRYSLVSLSANGEPIVRNMTNKRIKPQSGKDADFNSKFFDIAAGLVA